MNLTSFKVKVVGVYKIFALEVQGKSSRRKEGFFPKSRYLFIKSHGVISRENLPYFYLSISNSRFLNLTTQLTYGELFPRLSNVFKY